MGSGGVDWINRVVSYSAVTKEVIVSGCHTITQRGPPIRGKASRGASPAGASRDRARSELVRSVFSKQLPIDSARRLIRFINWREIVKNFTNFLARARDEV